MVSRQVASVNCPSPCALEMPIRPSKSRTRFRAASRAMGAASVLKPDSNAAMRARTPASTPAAIAADTMLLCCSCQRSARAAAARDSLRGAGGASDACGLLVGAGAGAGAGGVGDACGPLVGAGAGLGCAGSTAGGAGVGGVDLASPRSIPSAAPCPILLPASRPTSRPSCVVSARDGASWLARAGGGLTTGAAGVAAGGLTMGTASAGGGGAATGAAGLLPAPFSIWPSRESAPMTRCATGGGATESGCCFRSMLRSRSICSTWAPSLFAADARYSSPVGCE